MLCRDQSADNEDIYLHSIKWSARETVDFVRPCTRGSVRTMSTSFVRRLPENHSDRERTVCRYRCRANQCPVGWKHTVQPKFITWDAGIARETTACKAQCFRSTRHVGWRKQRVARASLVVKVRVVVRHCKHPQQLVGVGGDNGETVDEFARFKPVHRARGEKYGCDLYLAKV